MEIDNIDEIENLDEYFDFDTILQRMLDRVPMQIDKREGSIIYNALDNGNKLFYCNVQ